MTNNNNLINIATIDETTARTHLFTLARDCATYLSTSAMRNLDQLRLADPMTDFDYSGDHNDYNPAASSILDFITTAINSDESPSAIDIITRLLDTESLLLDCATLDFNSPLLALLDLDD